MKQQAFEARYASRWAEFAQWLKRARAPRARTDGAPSDIDPMEVPARYRELCQHLALARDRQYSADLIERLSSLALAGHQSLYGARSRGLERLWQFLRAGFPRAVRRDIRFVLLAALLFFGPLLLLTFVIPVHPEFAYVVAPAEVLDHVQEMYGDTARALGPKREADTDVAMFGFYIFNNVRIGFQTFAGGLLFGLGAIFYLLYNGLFIGAITGHIVYAGLATNFFSFTSGHSALELSAICLSGGAGLKLGFALVAPGRATRAQALRTAAAEAVPVVVGLAGMLLVAAAIEAFWSPQTFLPPPAKYAVGVLLWVLLLLYFIFAGRERAAR
jgi:uncharacterized membrane protein SpoIIM required for sporulation